MNWPGSRALAAMLLVVAVSGDLGAQPAPNAAATRPVLGADGFLRLGEQPYFPLGIYHDALDADYYGEKLLADFETIARARLNCLALSMDFSWDGQDPATSTAGKLAQRAEQTGIFLVPHVYLPDLDGFVRQQARWPAILASSLGDDFNTDEDGRFAGPPKYPPERLRQLDQRVKRAAAGHLTYSSGLAHPRGSLANYGNTVDILGIQCYPFGDGNQSRQNELEATQDLLENYWARTTPRPNPAVWANLQAFAWSTERAPTPQQMRAQAWLAILSRVRGILWYSFLSYDAKQPLPAAHPALWDELVSLVPEIHVVVPFIVDGQFTALPNPADTAFSDGPGTWHAATWRHAQGVLLVVVNAHHEQPAAIDLPSPAGAMGEPLRPFDGRRYPATLRETRGRVRGQIAAGGVEVLLWPTAHDEEQQ